MQQNENLNWPLHYFVTETWSHTCNTNTDGKGKYIPLKKTCIESRRLPHIDLCHTLGKISVFPVGMTEMLQYFLLVAYLITF